MNSYRNIVNQFCPSEMERGGFANLPQSYSKAVVLLRTGGNCADNPMAGPIVQSLNIVLIGTIFQSLNGSIHMLRGWNDVIARNF